MKRYGIGILFTLASAALLAAPGQVRAQSGPENLVLSFTNLAPLDEGADGHYEGWAIIGGMPFSTGKFNVNASGQPVELGGGPVIVEFDAGMDITSATAIKITIEPPGDMDAIPSGLVILSGDVMGMMAPLKTAVPNLDVLETMTAGAFFLATPSDNPGVPDNNDYGIWWLTMPGPAPGLTDLPDIGPNWTYEGWVVDVSGSPIPYSTGTFAVADDFDSDMAGPMGGGPPFPGQDFVAFQGGPVLDLDTGDFAAVITIEPVPDNLAAPFQLHPLAGPIPTDALGMNNPVNNQVLSTFPTGTAMLGMSVPVEANSWGSVKALFR
jgi:hypothetical protein